MKILNVAVLVGAALRYAQHVCGQDYALGPYSRQPSLTVLILREAGQDGISIGFTSRKAANCFVAL
jgi:hypothetical protein